MSSRMNLPASEHDAMPHGEFDHEGRLKVVIAGLDQNVRTHAVEAANARLNVELGEGGFAKKFLKGIWKGNAAREFYLTKYTREAERQIIEQENLLQHEGLNAEQYRVATTLRFAHEYDGLIHEGESRHAVLDRNEDGSTNAEGYQLKQDITKLIGDYAAGTFASDDDFQEAKKRMMTEAVEKGYTKDHIGEGLLYTDNLLQIAQNVKAMIDYRVATGESGDFDKIMANTDIVLGEARLGARTEVALSKTERLMKKLEGKAFLSESTVATAASVAFSVADWATKSALGAGGRAAGLIGVGSGVVAAVREKRILKEERAQHSREMAVGKGDIDTLSDRRESLEKARYETKTAIELKDQIGILYSSAGELKISTKDSFTDALNIMAECQARIRTSDEKNVDLISFSEVGSVEQERFELDLALAKAKCDLRSFMEAATDDELRAVGIADGDISDIRAGMLDPVDLVFEHRVNMAKELLVKGDEDYEGMDQKDRIYAKVRNGRMIKAFVKGTILGGTLGLVGQEAAAAMSDSTQGLVEGVLGHHDVGVSRESFLEGTFHHEAPMHLSGDYNPPLTLENGTKLTLPEEFKVESHGHSLSIDGPNGSRMENLSMSDDGKLTSESELALRQAGFSVSHDMGSISHDVTKTVTIDAKNFTENHSHDMTKVTRDFWYDNGTSNNYEGSELGLQSATVNNNGDFAYSVSGMDKGAWAEGGHRLDWHDAAAKGELKIALSASEGTQHDVFMVDVDADGNAIIPKGSPAASLFSNENGQAVFNGKFAEAVQVAGQDDHGVTHIRPLATDIGLGKNSFSDTIMEKESSPTHAYSLTYEPEKEPLISVPPVLPWYPRNGLGTLRKTPAGNVVAGPRTPNSPGISINASGSYLGSYFEGGPMGRDYYLSRMSPRLNSDPNVNLNEKEELAWYWDQQPADYKDKITETADDMGPMSQDVDIVVAIPVAGHQEMENIYKTLSAYRGQTMDKDKFEIVLYVNHPELDKEGNPTSAVKTLAEIQRFQADYPDMPIKVMYDKLARDDAQIAKIRKSLSDVILKRSMDRGDRGDRELIVVSNDADTSKVSDVYLENFVSRMNADKNIDTMLGQLDWDNEAFYRYPELHIGTRLFLYQEIMARKAGMWIGSSGANFAYRAKSYAAMGGYDPSLKGAGEDSYFGMAMSAAREGSVNKTPIGYGGNVQSRVETSARRAVYVLKTYDDAPLNQWNYSFSADDDEVRMLQLPDTSPDLDDPTERTRIITESEKMINKTFKAFAGWAKITSPNIRDNMDPGTRSFLERSVRLCGVRFDWSTDGSSISITDATDMFDGLKRFAAKQAATV